MKITNRQKIVLDTLREHGEMTAKMVGETVQDTTPCSGCDGSKTASDGGKCRRCNGRGHPYFNYGDAYYDLSSLLRKGLVERRKLRNDWGDETPNFVWWATDTPNTADALEALYQLPPAEVDS